MLLLRQRLVTNLGCLRKSHQSIAAIQRRCQQTSSDNVPAHRTFQEIITERRSQASRSIVVQVASQQSYDELYRYCSQLGTIKSAFHYTIPTNSTRHFILLEYDAVDGVNCTMESSVMGNFATGSIPVKSPFLWFRSDSKSTKSPKSIEPAVRLDTSHSLCAIGDGELANILRAASSTSHQMQLLYEHTKLNELTIRLRFLGAHQIEGVLNGWLSRSFVVPFGSSVNGFGRMGSDLDMILQYNIDALEPQTDAKVGRLVHHVKRNDGDDTGERSKEMIRKHLKVFATIFDEFMPGAKQVNGIYMARVPIIRYYHDFLHLDADISITNMSGFYVSELFHMLGEMDERVRPLVFTVRRWAQQFPHTKQAKQLNLTNFLWTCLVLSFLQQLKEPVLPAVSQLLDKTRPSDIRPGHDDKPYSFLRDLNVLGFKSKNTSSSEELFQQFLQFYTEFDFSRSMISLRSGKSNRKLDYSPLHIMNPFEVDQNWARNVPGDGCAVIKFQAQQTLSEWIFLKETEAIDKYRWGLLELFGTLK